MRAAACPRHHGKVENARFLADLAPIRQALQLDDDLGGKRRVQPFLDGQKLGFRLLSLCGNLFINSFVGHHATAHRIDDYRIRKTGIEKRRNLSVEPVREAGSSGNRCNIGIIGPERQKNLFHRLRLLFMPQRKPITARNKGPSGAESITEVRKPPLTQTAC